MRDGRRQRLGLVDGTEGTVQDTYLDRILSDVEVAGEPNILSLDSDANVRATDQRYLSDAYNYYLGGGPDASQDDFPIQAEDITPNIITRDDYPDDHTGPILSDTGNTPFEQNLLDQGVGVQGAPGDPVVAPGEMPVTQAEMDEFNQIPVTPQTYADTGRADLLEQAGNIEDIGYATDYQGDEGEVTADDYDTTFDQGEITADNYGTPATDLGEITADDYGTPTVAGGTATLADAGGTYDGMQSAEGGL